ncbi:hypothetical protein NBRC116595_17280 [Aliiglaciecola sp. NS0011-25]
MVSTVSEASSVSELEESDELDPQPLNNAVITLASKSLEPAVHKGSKESLNMSKKSFVIMSKLKRLFNGRN